MSLEPGDAALFAEAERILRDNDRGAYTIPTRGLYPFQWNWDSCLTALGQRHFDEARAWTEIENSARPSVVRRHGAAYRLSCP